MTGKPDKSFRTIVLGHFRVNNCCQFTSPNACEPYKRSGSLVNLPWKVHGIYNCIWFCQRLPTKFAEIKILNFYRQNFQIPIDKDANQSAPNHFHFSFSVLCLMPFLSKIFISSPKNLAKAFLFLMFYQLPDRSVQIFQSTAIIVNGVFIKTLAKKLKMQNISPEGFGKCIARICENTYGHSIYFTSNQITGIVCIHFDKLQVAIVDDCNFQPCNFTDHPKYWSPAPSS